MLTGKSYDAKALAANPSLAVDVFIAKPRMSHYLAMSAKIYGIYLKYVSAEDIHVYSVDEVFMDVTGYLRAYGKGVEEMTRDIIRDIHTQTGITATAGIGTNMYLAKVAMDIVAKHIQAGGTAFASPGLTRCRTGDCCGITGRLPISGVWGVDMQGSSKRTGW